MPDTTNLTILHSRGSKTVAVPTTAKPQRLTETLRQAGLPLNTRCGQHGLCDGCLVDLISGRLRRQGNGQVVQAEPQGTSVRACEFSLFTGEAATVRVPTRSLLAHAPQVVTSFRSNVTWAHDPLVQPPATGPRQFFGAAVDIGTTTVVVTLVDLFDGQSVSTASAMNAQTRLGDNVLTRINLCTTDKSKISRLQQAIISRTIRPLLREALDEAGAWPDQISCLVMAGNTTMLHLLVGEDPTSMGVAPFTPAFVEHRKLRCSDLAAKLLPAGGAADPEVHLLPSAAAYVGADVVAGVFSSGMIYDQQPCLLVDIGTNGEIVLKHGDRLLGCATAAGPAFEGAGLVCGMRAGAGAVSHIRLNRPAGNHDLEVIGGGEPIGVCGTAYIDFMAQGRAAGLLGSNGRFLQGEDFAGHVHCGQHGLSYTLAAHEEGRIVICEVDVASLLQAKAAIAAGIELLLRRVGLQAGDIARLYLAGGFGFHMNVENVIGCGLLPGFTPQQIELVGNTALAGAYLALLDQGVLDQLKQIGSRLETIELNLDPEFETTYIDHLSLPAPSSSPSPFPEQ